MVLQDRHQPPGGCQRPVERCGHLRPAVLVAIPNTQPAGLESRAVRRRGQFPVCLLGGHPSLAVELPGRRCYRGHRQRHRSPGRGSPSPPAFPPRTPAAADARLRRPRTAVGRTSRPCRTGAPGGSRGCPCRTNPPPGGNTTTTRRTGRDRLPGRGSRRRGRRRAGPRRSRPDRGRRPASRYTSSACSPRKPVPSMDSGLTSTGGIIGMNPLAIALFTARVSIAHCSCAPTPRRK